MAFYKSVLWFWLVWTNTASGDSVGPNGGMYRVDRRDLRPGSLATSYVSRDSSRRPNDDVMGGSGVHRVDRHDFNLDQPFSSNNYLQSQYTVVQRTSMEGTRSLPRLFIPAAPGGAPPPTSFDWRRNSYDQIMPIATYLGGSNGYELRTPRAVLATSTPRQIYDVAATPRQIFDVAETPARPIIHASNDDTLPATTINGHKTGAMPNADDDSKPLPAITSYGKAKIDRRMQDEDDHRRPTINELAESGEESDLVETFEPESLPEGHGDGGSERGSTVPIKRRRRLSTTRAKRDNLANLINRRQLMDGYIRPVIYERFVVHSVEVERSALHEAEFVESGTEDFDGNEIGSLWFTPYEWEIQAGNGKEWSNDDRVFTLPETTTVTEKQNPVSSVTADNTAKTSPSTHEI